tara:strand:- start:1149 stop:1718 length:570 start_codon:yes stop_codon:yes gene_type:complete
LKQTKINKITFWGNLDESKLKYLKNKISLSFKMPIKHTEDWKKCSIISNFFTDYCTSSMFKNKKEIKSILSTIINELIENAIKHSYKDYNEINIFLINLDNEIIFITENIAPQDNTNNLIHTMNQLKHSNIESLILNRIKNNFMYNQENSEIGLLNIANNYRTTIGARITPIEKTKLNKIELITSIKYE